MDDKKVYTFCKILEVKKEFIMYNSEWNMRKYKNKWIAESA